MLLFDLHQSRPDRFQQGRKGLIGRRSDGRGWGRRIRRWPSSSRCGTGHFSRRRCRNRGRLQVGRPWPRRCSGRGRRMDPPRRGRGKRTRGYTASGQASGRRGRGLKGGITQGCGNGHPQMVSGRLTMAGSCRNFRVHGGWRPCSVARWHMLGGFEASPTQGDSFTPYSGASVHKHHGSFLEVCRHFFVFFRTYRGKFFQNSAPGITRPLRRNLSYTFRRLNP